MDGKITIARLESALDDYNNSSLSLREISKKHNICRATITGFFLGRGIDIYTRKSKVNTRIFEIIDNEEKAYWLGFLYADGGLYHYKKSRRIELSLQKRDYEHLLKFAKFIDFRGSIKYRESLKAYRIIFGCEKMYRDLTALGCVEKKSLILTFPSNGIVPSQYIRHFVRGYFDGDGCIELCKTVHSGYRKIISLLGTKEFLAKLLDTLPFKTSYETKLIRKTKDNNSNNYYIQLRKAESSLFLDYIYKDCSIYLDRKYQRYLLK